MALGRRLAARYSGSAKAPSVHRIRVIASLVVLLGLGFVIFYVGFRRDFDVAMGDDGVLIGLLAVIYAAIQFADAKETIGDIDRVDDTLRKTSEALRGELGLLKERLADQQLLLDRFGTEVSTRQIQRFPYFFDDVVDLLEEARGEVVIFCDHPGYAVYSNPDAYARYAQIVRKLGQSVRVKCLDSRKRKDLYRQQIENTGTGSFAIWKDDSRMDAFLRVHGTPKDSPATITEERFLQLLGASDDRAWNQEFAEAQKSTTPVMMPLFFWLAECESGERAIFALGTLHQDSHEVGFASRDPALLTSLKRIFERWPETRPRRRKGSGVA